MSKPETMIFAEAARHLAAAEEVEMALSETTRRSLAFGKPEFTIEELSRMLVPGNPVNRRWRDIYYRIDGQSADENDPVMQKLLKIAERSFGAPEPSLTLAGRTVSHITLHSALIARRVIAAVEKTGKSKPNILEIGGGLGIVLAILRCYYRDQATLHAIDVPQGLFLQEWYVKNSDRSTVVMFKADRQDVDFQDGGLNLINAAIFDHQALSIDVAYSIDAFSDMSGEIADRYIAFLAKCLSECGRFLFIASYGQGKDGHRAPSEYSFDERWRVDRVELLRQTESMQPEEQLLLEMERSEQKVPEQNRRWGLRLLWNLLAGRHLSGDAIGGLSGGALFEDLAVDPLAALGNWASKNRLSIDAEDIKRLSEEVYLPPRILTSRLALGTQCDPAVKLGEAHREVVRLMRAAAKSDDLACATAVGQELRDGLEALREFLPAVSSSVFWTAQMAGVLLPLTAIDECAHRVLDAASKSSDHGWRIQCATLLERYGFKDQALQLLDPLATSLSGFPFFDLKRAELLSRLEKHEAAKEVLIARAHQGIAGEQWRQVFAKTAYRLGIPEHCIEFAKNALQAGCGQAVYDMLAFVLNEQTGVPPQVFGLLESWRGDLKHVGDEVGLAALLYAAGEHESAAEILASALDWNDYYRLAGNGRRLLAAGNAELGARCLEVSADGAVQSFLHQEFIGKAFLQAGMFRKAHKYLTISSEICPILIHLHGQASFAGLPERLRESGVFGFAGDQPVIFQRWQDFYHDIGPRFR